MKKIFLLIALAFLTISTASALDPIKVAIVNNGGAAVNVQVNLTNYTGGAATNIYASTPQSLTPNGSGIIMVDISDATHASGTLWSAITPASVNSYYVIDVNVGGNLYAQYRLDQQIISQSQGGVFDNDGNLSPSSDGSQNLGNDDNRWGELFVEGNTIHVGPAGGMGSDELAFSYNDATNTATMTVAGIDELKLNTNGASITGGFIANPSGANKDFIFGDDNFDYNSGTESKMYFDKSKGAFRTGAITSTQWDDANVGDYSFASGFDTKASGKYSTAMGFGTTANEDYSTALGYGTNASGIRSTAMGFATFATGDYSTAMGYNSTAGGKHSTSMGYNTVANGDNSTAMGFASKSEGHYSTAMGLGTIASGERSTTMGSASKAIGNNSTAMGFAATAKSYAETVVGSYNTDYTVSTNGATAFDAADRAFVVGNGTLSSSSDALVVYKSGDVVVPSLGNTTSTQNLQVDATGKLVTSITATVIVSAIQPPTTIEGNLWYDTVSSALKIYVSGGWVVI